MVLLPKCQQCDPCSYCDDRPTTLTLNVKYSPSDNGKIVSDNKYFWYGLNGMGVGPDPPPGVNYPSDLTTTCRPSDKSVWYIRLTDKGSGYSYAPEVTFSGGDPESPATGSCAARVHLTDVTVENGGAGYKQSPSVTFRALPSQPVTTSITCPPRAAAVVRGAVSGVTLTSDPGGWESDGPVDVTISDQTGSGAKATATLTGYVHEVVIDEPGYFGGGSAGVQFGNVGTPPASANAKMFARVISVPLENFPSGYYTAVPELNPQWALYPSTATLPTLEPVVRGPVSSIQVTNPGGGYPASPAPSVSIFDKTGSGATATATLDGYVDKVTVTNGGGGYNGQADVGFSGGGSGATAIASMSSYVDSVSLLSGGSGYTSAPIVNAQWSGVGGTPPRIAAQIDPATGSVVGLSIIDPGRSNANGDGSPRQCLVGFVGGGGTGAAAQVTTYNTVDSVSVLQRGSGYGPNTGVSFTGGTGTQATASVSYCVSKIQVVSGGSNYGPSPQVAISPVPGGPTAPAQRSMPTLTPYILSDTGSGARIAVVLSKAADAWTVSSVSVLSGGSGYQVDDYIWYQEFPDFASSAPNFIVEFDNLAVTEVGAGGEIVSISGFGGAAPYGGAYYKSEGGIATAEATISGSVTAVNVVNPGRSKGGDYCIINYLMPDGSPGFFLAETSNGVESVSLPSDIRLRGSGVGPDSTVSFTGGTGAQGHVVAKYRIKSIDLTDGGSNYGPSPVVSLSNYTPGVKATADINGSVTEVVVSDRGIFDTSVTSPDIGVKVEFSGGGGTGAAAKPVFGDGVVTGAEVRLYGNGRGYKSVPSVSLSGGGGSDAAATAYLTYEDDHTLVFDLEKRQSPENIQSSGSMWVPCGTGRDTAFCTKTNAWNDGNFIMPINPMFTCGTYYGDGRNQLYGEQLSWGVNVNLYPYESSPPSSTPVEEWFTRFKGEMLSAGLYVGWTFGPGRYSPTLNSSSRRFVKRLYSRVEPEAVYKSPLSLGANQASFSPSFRQSDDLKGDPIWVMESISVASGGSGLNVQATGTMTLDLASGNIVALFDSPVTIQYTSRGGTITSATLLAHPAVTGQSKYITSEIYTEPSDVSASIPRPSPLPTGFTAATLSVSLSPGESRTYWEVSGVMVLNAGAGYVDDQGDGIPVVFSVGHGDVESVCASAVARLGPRQEPTVVASVPGGTADASLQVQIGESQTSAGGVQVWPVASVTVSSPGDGYMDGNAVSFAPGSVSHQVVAAAATIQTLRAQPSLSLTGSGTGAVFAISYDFYPYYPPTNYSFERREYYSIRSVGVTDGGSGYVDGEQLSVSLGTGDRYDSANTGWWGSSDTNIRARTRLIEPQVTASLSSGSGAVLSVSLVKSGRIWKVSGVEVLSGGSGYSGGETVVFSGGDGGIEHYPANAEAVVDTDTGAVVSVSLLPDVPGWPDTGGVYYDDSGEIVEATVFLGGAFYKDTGKIARVILYEGGAYYGQSGQIQSVDVTFGGRYFRRQIIETEQELPPVKCKGEVTSEWEEVTLKPLAPPDEQFRIDVGETWLDRVQTAENIGGIGGYPRVVEFERTRVCEPPEIKMTLG